jgi:hypothetical protein
LTNVVWGSPSWQFKFSEWSIFICLRERHQRINASLSIHFSERDGQDTLRRRQVSTCPQKTHHHANMLVFMQLAKGASQDEVSIFARHYACAAGRCSCRHDAGVDLREGSSCHNWRFADEKSSRIVERDDHSFGVLYRQCICGGMKYFRMRVPDLEEPTRVMAS